MRSFTDLDRTLANQPLRVGALLRRVNTGLGREQLFAEQSPQLLQALAEATRVASIQASTAIEGYDVPDQRAEQIARNPDVRFRNRNEKEFAGYRDAVDEMARARRLDPISAAYPFYLVGRLHRHTTGEPGGPKKDQNYIVTYENGARRVVFEPVEPQFVESSIRSLATGYNDALVADVADPALLLGLFILDFLAIHPVADGNGRVSRLLMVHELLRLGYGVARYVSIEQLIFESKNSYYDALESSQAGWHTAEHDAWPWLAYFVSILAEAYGNFEAKVAGAQTTHGSKADRVREYALNEAPDEFRFAEVVAALPGISSATVRNVLNALRAEGKFEATRGANATWRRL